MSSRSTLVVGVDFGVPSLRALRHALGMLTSGATREVHALHVLPVSASDGAVERVPHALGAVVEALLRRHEVPRGSRAWAHARCGVPRWELRRLAFDVGASTVVLGEAPQREGDASTACFAPFSVLVAGEGLTLEARRFVPARCPVCAKVASVDGAFDPFCVEHRRAGASVLPLALRADSLSGRLH